MSRLDDLRAQYQRLTGQEQTQRRDITAIEKEVITRTAQGVIITKTKEVIQELANDARGEFKGEVDGLVTLAVRSVFSEDFNFDLQMTTDGGRLQCKPVVWETIHTEDEGDVQVEYIPKDEMGGSVLDPIGVALRVVLQNFQRNPTRVFFLLDEPMKNVGHGELLVQAGLLLQELSHSLNLQFVIITHEPELMQIADRAWHVTRTRGKSEAVVVKDTAIPEPKPQRRVLIK